MMMIIIITTTIIINNNFKDYAELYFPFKIEFILLIKLQVLSHSYFVTEFNFQLLLYQIYFR
jgi:hypothetical protein